MTKKQTASPVHQLVEQCVGNLNKIIHLSHEVVASLDTGDYDKTESLLVARGAKIDEVTEMERELNRLYASDPDSIPRSILTYYLQHREPLYNGILQLDSKVSEAIQSSKETVLTEMKDLYRGRRMNDGYLNLSASSAFVDIKE